jgi:hypothetical protein
MTKTPDLMPAFVVTWTPTSTSHARDKAGAKGFAHPRAAYEYLSTLNADPVFDNDTLRLGLVNVPTWWADDQITDHAIGDDGDDKVVAVREPGKAVRFHKPVDREQYLIVDREREAALPDRWKIETITDSDRSVGLTMIRGNQSHTTPVTPDEADALIVALLARKLNLDFVTGTVQAQRLLTEAVESYTQNR